MTTLNAKRFFIFSFAALIICSFIASLLTPRNYVNLTGWFNNFSEIATFITPILSCSSLGTYFIFKNKNFPSHSLLKGFLSTLKISVSLCLITGFITGLVLYYKSIITILWFSILTGMYAIALTLPLLALLSFIFAFVEFRIKHQPT